jgi:hypothetical protein
MGQPGFRKRITPEQREGIIPAVKASRNDFDALPEWLRTAVLQTEAELGLEFG